MAKAPETLVSYEDSGGWNPDDEFYKGPHGKAWLSLDVADAEKSLADKNNQRDLNQLGNLLENFDVKKAELSELLLDEEFGQIPLDIEGVIPDLTYHPQQIYLLETVIIMTNQGGVLQATPRLNEFPIASGDLADERIKSRIPINGIAKLAPVSGLGAYIGISWPPSH